MRRVALAGALAAAATVAVVGVLARLTARASGPRAALRRRCGPSLEVELAGRSHDARVQGRGLYLASGREPLGNAIQRVRCHLAGGPTVTCDQWGAC